jgi:hypothetical protein
MGKDWFTPPTPHPKAACFKGTTVAGVGPTRAHLDGQPALAVLDGAIRPRRRQPLRRLGPALARRQVQRRVAVAVLHVAVGLGPQQHVQHSHVAACRSWGEGQRCGAAEAGWAAEPCTRGRCCGCALPAGHGAGGAPEAALCRADDPFWLCRSTSQPAATSRSTTAAWPLSAAATAQGRR